MGNQLMGKPYKAELNALEETYLWAKEIDIEPISRDISHNFFHPLISVGSGGSFSCAEMHSSLHKKFAGTASSAITPMDLIYSFPRDGMASIWFVSAGGNNIDIQRAFKHASLLEPAGVSALVGRENSKLRTIASKFSYTNFLEYPIPCGKDGFLATNSLLAFSILLVRSYHQVVRKSLQLPPTLKSFISRALPKGMNVQKISFAMSQIWQCNTVHVVYSPFLKCVAVDIESKFTEAGLGSVNISDLRNFAHGRHHWFSKQSQDICERAC